MSLLAKAAPRPSTIRTIALRTATVRSLSFISNEGDYELSAELLRGLAALNHHCPIATQTIENVTTEEVMRAVKARDYGAIANLQWSAEVDYLKKMSARGICTDAKPRNGPADMAKRTFSSGGAAAGSKQDVLFTASFLKEISTPKNKSLDTPVLNDAGKETPSPKMNVDTAKRPFSSSAQTKRDVPFTASFLRQLSTPKNKSTEVPRMNAKKSNKKNHNKPCWSVDGEIYIP